MQNANMEFHRKIEESRAAKLSQFWHITYTDQQRFLTSVYDESSLRLRVRLSAGPAAIRGTWTCVNDSRISIQFNSNSLPMDSPDSLCMMLTAQPFLHEVL